MDYMRNSIRGETIPLVMKCLKLLSKKDRFKFFLISGIQMTLVILDLLGVLILGIIAAIGVSAVRGESYAGWISELLQSVGLLDQTPQNTALALGLVASIALIAKSVFSFFLSFKILSFLSNREAQIASSLSRSMLSTPLVKLNRYATPEFQFAITSGANFVTVGVLGQAATILSEVILQLVMLTTLFVYSPQVMLSSLAFFGSLFLILNYYLGNRASLLGQELANVSVDSHKEIADAIGSYREIVVLQRRDFFVRKITKLRLTLAEKGIRQALLSQISKYIFEVSTVIAGVSIAGFAFFTSNAIDAVELITVFLAASSRIVPSLMKLQMGWVGLKGAIGGSTRFFTIYEDVFNEDFEEEVTHKLYENSKPTARNCISLDNVSFIYPGEKQKLAVDGISLTIPNRGLVALVGPSGSGKSTLVDLILGVHSASSGTISYSFSNSRGSSIHGARFAYVPQDVYLVSGSLIQNVCFGIPEMDWDLEKASRCLLDVGLDDLMMESDAGLYRRIRERGIGLSGGQKQRLGIARALYAEPEVLVLDEATSSLDAESESKISQIIDNKAQAATVIVIAHRLSTVIRANQISYLENGKIIATGTFNQLRTLVPNFDRQAELMGIQKE
jgi:ABC-type multidrug transport system fused ATPase/permease subunit